MRFFRLPIIVSTICMAIAAIWGFRTGGANYVLPVLGVTAILALMEISLSFDNAVVNATVLKNMEPKWQQRFLTLGILVAVFGMRLVFPILIVAIASGQGMNEVTQLAVNHPEIYAAHLQSSHAAIASFGGTFLFLVFLSFLIDESKEVHWLGAIEEKIAKLHRIDYIKILITLGLLLGLYNYLPISAAERGTLLLSGVSGLCLFIAVESLGSFFESENSDSATVKSVKRSGVFSFVYLELLDASFSFDGVMGALAITRDIVVIMLGLAIGATFIRSLTVFLVQKGTLNEYVFLEHGAHYAIGALSLIMFYSIFGDVPELYTGLAGISFIVLSLISSWRYKRAPEA